MSTTESRDKLEQIRRVRAGGEEQTETPELFSCPIEGCSRTVVGEPNHLRNHVRQSGDEAHRNKRLSEDLEIERAWEEMDWGFGIPAFDIAPALRERESVYEAGDPWGPSTPQRPIRSRHMALDND